MNEFLFFLEYYLFLIDFFDRIGDIRYFFLLNCLFSLSDGVILIERIHFLLHRKARQHVGLLGCKGNWLAKGRVFDILHNLSLFGSVILCDFRGLDLENLYAEAEFLCGECHLLVGVVFLVVGSHVLKCYL